MQGDPLQRAIERQRLASHPQLSVWVAAAAGAGKTKVLIDRYVRLLLAGTPPEKILCLTYTQAAAAEMVARVTARLSHWAVCRDDDLDRDLAALTGETAAARAARMPRARTLFAIVLDCTGGLRIKTFHAFAQEVLTRFPLEAGVAPHFTVLEDEAARTLRASALDAMLATDNPVVQKAWRTLVSQHPADKAIALLQELLHDKAKLRTAQERYGEAAGLRAALTAMTQCDLQQTPDDLVRAFCAAPRLPDALCAAWQEALQKTNKADAAAVLQRWRRQAPDERAEQFAAYQKLFLTKNGTIFAHLLTKEQEALAPMGLRAALLAEAEAVVNLVQHTRRQNRALLTVAVQECGLALQQAYDAAKARAAALDFDDVITHTANLLEQPGMAPWVLWKLDGGLDHIMIDEAQDTSPTQWRIIKALIAEFFAGQGARQQRRTLFVVGDEKQSIYSFQHADPTQFQAVRDFFAAQSKAAGCRFIKLTLDVSFRSVPLVLEKIDTIFKPPATQAGVSSVPVQHFSTRPKAPGQVRFWPVVRGGAEKTEVWSPAADYDQRGTPLTQLAENIAGQIAAWLKDEQPVAVREQGREILRPIMPGDIMILVRRRNALVPALLRALKARRVPVSGIDRLRLKDALAVQDLLALMQFVLLPEDDLNLACVLRGPLLGLDDAMLESLCVGRPEAQGTLWAALQAEPVLSPLTGWLRTLLASADTGTTYDFLQNILIQPCPTASSGKQALVTRLGPDALDPIEALLDAAQRFALLQLDSLQHFYQQMVTDEADIKRPVEQNAGVVRIMTAHAAKGLQAPVVILPDSCTPPRTQELGALQWDGATGLPYYCGGTSATLDERAAALRNNARVAQLAEYRRLLYVALTRAECALDIYGMFNKKQPNDFAESWYERIRTGLGIAADGASAGQPLAEWADPQLGAITQPVASDLLAAALPPWAAQPAPVEAAPLQLSPSQLDPTVAVTSPVTASARAALLRGQLMHRLLQYVPALPDDTRAAATRQFLAGTALPPEEQGALVAEFLHLLAHPGLAPLFGTASRAEVPLVGTLPLAGGGQAMVSGQVDRLVITPQEILIIDYKTNRPPPAAVPTAYRQQMAAYRALLRQIYPLLPVRCYLLWTFTATLQEVPDDGENVLLSA